MNASSDFVRLILDPTSALLKRRELQVTAMLMLLGTGVCEASNVKVTDQNFLTGSTIIEAEVNPITDTDCGKQRVTAPTQIGVPDINSSTGYDTYTFMFWDINAVPYTTVEVNFQPICGQDNFAVAVYMPPGGGGNGPDPDITYAYSLKEHHVIAGATPIASATAGWISGSQDVTPPSTIQAEPEIPPYGTFQGWLLGQTISSSPSLKLTTPNETVIGYYGMPCTLVVTKYCFGPPPPPPPWPH